MRGVWIGLAVYGLILWAIPPVLFSQILTFTGWLAGLGVFAGLGWYAEWKLDEAFRDD